MKTLKINGLTIEIGKSVDKKILSDHKIKKLGLISRLIINKEPGQTIWWSKNCDIFCFNDNFNLCPIIDTTSGSKMMYGTSAYLFFNGKVLAKVTFQLIGNSIAADWILDKFNDSATKAIGKPINEGDKIIWDDGQNYIIAERILNSSNAHFHWLSK